MLPRLLAVLPLTPVLAPLAASLALLLLRLWRPRFALFWMLAALGGLAAWISFIPLRSQLPLSLSMSVPGLDAIFTAAPALLVDSFSWAYGLALATILVGVILTDVARADEVSWTAWATSLMLVALGLGCVLAGNLLTLLLAWTLLDLVELALLLSQAPRNADRERIIITIFIRLAGTVVIQWAEIVALTSGTRLTYETIPPAAAPILLLGIWLRLGLFPIQSPFSHDLPLLRGQATLLRLTPAAAALPLAARVASATAGEMSPFLLFLAAGGSLLGGIFWALAHDELEGRLFWTLGMGALSLAAALRGQAEASLVLGLALLLSGGMLFLYSARHRRLFFLPVLGLLIASTLPLTPTWMAVRLYEAPFRWLLPIFLVGQAFLLVGFLYHALRPGDDPFRKERWVILVYPLGLLLFPLAAFLITWWGPLSQATRPDLVSSWPAAAVLGLAMLLVAWERRSPRLPASIINRVQLPQVNLIINNLVWAVYRAVRRSIAFLNIILEGEGGILWTILFLVLLFSLLIQGGG